MCLSDIKAPALRFVVFYILVFTACITNYPLDLGENYRLDYDPNSYFNIVGEDGLILIDSHVSGFGFDSLFIVVEQKPIDFILKGTYHDPEMNLQERKH